MAPKRSTPSTGLTLRIGAVGVGLAQRQHRVDHREALAHRRRHRRMACHQRAVAVQQRDGRADVGLDVVVELLEVLDAAAGDDRAGEVAIGPLQAARDRQHPSLRVQHAAAQAAHDQLGAAVLQHRVQRIVRRVDLRAGQRGSLRTAHQLAGGVEQQQAFGLHERRPPGPSSTRAGRLGAAPRARRRGAVRRHGAAPGRPPAACGRSARPARGRGCRAHAPSRRRRRGSCGRCRTRPVR